VKQDHGILFKVGLPVLGFAVFVALWWSATALFHVDTFMVPSPWDVAHSMRVNHALLLKSTWISLKESLGGFLIAAAGALILALLLTASRYVEQAAMPLLVTINAIPKLAVAPLILVWMGFGQGPKIVMAVLICFFPILISAVTGLTSAPADFGELARSLSSSRWKTFVKMRLPWALPQVFVGLKVAVGLAIIGTVVQENAGALEGLGYVITSAEPAFDTPLAFASVILLTIMSIVLFYALVGMERLILPWAREITDK
jgi:NitT/TauT family transport system permease protein